LVNSLFRLDNIGTLTTDEGLIGSFCIKLIIIITHTAI